MEKFKFSISIWNSKINETLDENWHKLKRKYNKKAYINEHHIKKGNISWPEITSNNFSNPLDLGIPLGDQGGHFEENTFGRELMTPFLNDGGLQPATKLTLNVLKTIGWKIDITKAQNL